MKVYFFDTETTGNDPTDRLCQLAIKERGVTDPFLNELYKPPLQIPPMASAVHHISNKMVADKSSFAGSADYQKIKDLFENEDNLVIAHNAAFDVQMLANEGITARNIICTYKVVQHIDRKGEFEMYRLQYLRYALEMELDVPAHDALGDVLVLEKLFEYLLSRIMKENNIDEAAAVMLMQEMTNTPVLVREFNFGKHKGKSLEEISLTAPDYLQWLLLEKEKNPTGEEDWLYTLRYYLKKL